MFEVAIKPFDPSTYSPPSDFDCGIADISCFLRDPALRMNVDTAVSGNPERWALLALNANQEPCAVIYFCVEPINSCFVRRKFGDLEQNMALRSGHMMYVSLLGVDQRFRKGGEHEGLHLGTRLLAEALLSLHERKPIALIGLHATDSSFETRSSAPASWPFYTKLGYVMPDGAPEENDTSCHAGPPMIRPLSEKIIEGMKTLCRNPLIVRAKDNRVRKDNPPWLDPRCGEQ